MSSLAFARAFNFVDMKRIIALFLTALTASVALVAQPNAPDIVVSADGKGAFTSLQEAILSVRDYKPTRTTIYVRNGIYNEKVLIPANKCDITIVGESVEGVVVSYGDYAKLNAMGTFKTSTFRIDGDGIRLENITIENTADPAGGQAVALHIEGDRCEFVNCRLLGNQDTLFNGGRGKRQYFRKCYIEGTTDFIFGPATVWFEECHVHCKANSYITAASTPDTVDYGLVFNRCEVTADSEVNRLYLGRPWREYASTLFMHCSLPACIVPEGWHNWGRTENEKTARYAEHENTGEGAQSDSRAAWSRQLTPDEASRVTLEVVMTHSSSWEPAYNTEK